MNKPTHTISISVVYHKKSPLLSSQLLSPIIVGNHASFTDRHLHFDNTDENMSHKNPHFCELTAQYWVWKNLQGKSHIGFMHYRRVFDFEGQYRSKKNELKLQQDNLFSLASYTETADALIPDILSKYDIIIPESHRIATNVWAHYEERHIIDHLVLTQKIIEKRHSSYSKSFDACMQGNKLTPFNMFVFPAKLYSEYMTWLFDILFELEKHITVTELSPYQSRVFGFISERLLGVFIHRQQQLNPNLKIKKCKVLNINEATIVNQKLPQKPNGFLSKILQRIIRT
ncbi:MAG: DUF4422 domain-containing protein [Desulfovibrionales bacterium]|nr:DUF4422 domain-containing protein [Desulfovibrionales bacterium]